VHIHLTVSGTNQILLNPTVRRACRIDDRDRARQTDRLTFMPEHPEPLSILIVCDGNVCRSPAAQFEVRRQLPGARVESAGMHARSGSRLCEVVASAVRAEGSDGDEFVDGFRSRHVADVDLREFDLALTATKELRADLAMAEPGLRDRFFTLREAAHIFGGDQGFEFTDGVESAQLIEFMNRRRGTIPMQSDRRQPRAMRESDPYDIPDAHRARPRRHAVVVEIALETGSAIGTVLAQRLGRAGVVDPGP
jgi:protein-tyrosine phosphatase